MLIRVEIEKLIRRAEMALVDELDWGGVFRKVRSDMARIAS